MAVSLAVSGSAFAASAITIPTPTTNNSTIAGQIITPSANNAGQQNLITNINNVTNKLNASASSLGVATASQIQNSITSGSVNGVAASGTVGTYGTVHGGVIQDLGQLFYYIDNYGNAASNQIGLSDSGQAGITLTGSAPTTSIGITDIVAQANATASDYAIQVSNTTAGIVLPIANNVTAYNSKYGGSGNVNSTNLAQAQADYNSISGEVTTANTGIIAARTYGQIGGTGTGYGFLGDLVNNSNGVFTSGSLTAGSSTTVVSGSGSGAVTLNNPITYSIGNSVVSGLTAANINNFVAGLQSGNTLNTATTLVSAPAATTITLSGTSVTGMTIGSKFYKNYTDYVRGVGYQAYSTGYGSFATSVPTLYAPTTGLKDPSGSYNAVAYKDVNGNFVGYVYISPLPTPTYIIGKVATGSTLTTTSNIIGNSQNISGGSFTTMDAAVQALINNGVSIQ